MILPLKLLVLAALASETNENLILHGGKIFVSPGRWASAVAVEGNRIAAVGRDREILKRKKSGTRLIDLKGRTVTPGFHDAHLHFMKGAFAMAQADLNGATSPKMVADRVAKWLKGHPTAPWALGRGWDHTSFPGQKYPTRLDLDAVTSTLPAALTHVDGHLLWMNTAGLRQAGITRDTPDPKDGQIERGPDGDPTGVLIEGAMALGKKALPEPDAAAVAQALKNALAAARKAGVTSIQGPMDLQPRVQLQAWRDLDRAGEVSLRWFIWGELDKPDEFYALSQEFADLPRERFRFGGLKGFVDGVISARTAAMMESYSDTPGLKGKANYSPEDLSARALTAQSRGWQVCLHAVGDLAVRMALNACQSLSRSRGTGAYPCKIEHIEAIDPDDYPRFASLRVAASMQPSHMTYDMQSQNYNPQRLGARAAHAFAWKSLETAGATLAFGTDWPVMPLDPAVNLFAAVTRQHFNGLPPKGWIPEQRIGLENALAHYTVGPARAIGRENELGTVEEGKLADLVVWDRDLMKLKGTEILKAKVDTTIFNGKVVYERNFGNGIKRKKEKKR